MFTKSKFGQYLKIFNLFGMASSSICCDVCAVDGDYAEHWAFYNFPKD